MPHNDDDGIEMLTPGHFLIGRPISAIPDHPESHQVMSLLHRWYLCECLVRHFWERWRKEYLTALQRRYKWKYPTRNLQVGDLVIIKDDHVIPTNWPIARVIETHSGTDNITRVVTIKAKDGIYKRPITKLCLLLPCE